jgi:protein-disulfide isomerase
METNENKYFLPAAVVIAGLFIGGAVLWNGAHPSPAGVGGGGQVAGAGQVPAVDIKNVNIAGNPFIGAANASVVIAFWSDFQCPFCKKFVVETLSQIEKEYVDTGKAKVVFMDFPFLGEDSIAGAAYSLAVWKLYPSSYLAWHTAMYNAQDDEGDQGFGDAASIDELNATIAGIDAAKVAADVKENMAAYQAQIDVDKAEAKKAGISATPSAVIGKKAIVGAYPYAEFKAAIEAVLK